MAELGTDTRPLPLRRWKIAKTFLLAGVRNLVPRLARG